jgi:hypothetical protein
LKESKKWWEAQPAPVFVASVRKNGSFMTVLKFVPMMRTGAGKVRQVTGRLKKRSDGEGVREVYMSVAARGAIVCDYSAPFPLPQLVRRPVGKAFDGRSLRIMVLLIAVGILNLIDLVYTVFAHRLGVGSNLDMLNETNPLAAVFLSQGLVSSLVCFKILMVMCGLGMLWKLRESKLAVPACWLLLIAYSYLGLVWYHWVTDVNHYYEQQITSAFPIEFK